MTTTRRDAALDGRSVAWPMDPGRRGSAGTRTPDHHLFAKTAHTRRARVAADDSTRPVNAADAAQARLFAEILRDEIAQLEEIARSAQARLVRRGEGDIGDREPLQEIAQLRARLEEAHRLLNALCDRFPQA